jgi:transposase
MAARFKQNMLEAAWMNSKFVDTDRNTLYLLPPSVQDWLPEGHLARFVVDIVSQLNLEPLRCAYAGVGSKAYDPEMLLALLFYGYATRLFSSRQMERATYDSVAFRYIAANTHPDHDTIASFRKRFIGYLKPLFVEILMVARTLGMLKLGKVSLDGTKVKANASKHHALSWGHACRLEAQLKEEVETLLRQAEAADRADVPDGMSIPEELARRKDRLEAIAKAKEEIERRAAERHAREKEAYEQKVAERQKKHKATGKKPRGRQPKEPQAGPPRTEDQLNLTDPESRIMPTSTGGFEQAYNGQVSVDMDSLLIVENHVSQSPNDKQEMEPALEGLDGLPKKMGKVEAVVADPGYFSQDNVEKCEGRQITPLIQDAHQRHNRSWQERFAQPPPVAEDADAVTRMRHRLRTAQGRALYAKRKSTVEPVFGIIKAVMGFRQFLLRGLTAVKGEWNLVCIAWNIKRMHVMVTG